jgi:hypothetical protein
MAFAGPKLQCPKVRRPAALMGQKPRRPAGGGPAYDQCGLASPVGASWACLDTVAAHWSRAVVWLLTALHWLPHDVVYAKLMRESRGWPRATRERQGLTVRQCQ